MTRVKVASFLPASKGQSQNLPCGFAFADSAHSAGRFSSGGKLRNVCAPHLVFRIGDNIRLCAVCAAIALAGIGYACAAKALPRHHCESAFVPIFAARFCAPVSLLPVRRFACPLPAIAVSWQAGDNRAACHLSTGRNSSSAFRRLSRGATTGRRIRSHTSASALGSHDAMSHKRHA